MIGSLDVDGCVSSFDRLLQLQVSTRNGARYGSRLIKALIRVYRSNGIEISTPLALQKSHGQGESVPSLGPYMENGRALCSHCLLDMDPVELCSLHRSASGRVGKRAQRMHEQKRVSLGRVINAQGIVIGDVAATVSKIHPDGTITRQAEPL